MRQQPEYSRDKGGQGRDFGVREQKEVVRVVRGHDCIQGLICE